MKLLLDLGNSRCKYAVVENDDVKQYAVENYGPFGKMYSVKTISDKHNDVDEIIISSVLSEEMNSQIKETLLSGAEKKVFFLAPAENSFGMQLAYDDPSAIGVDRVAALIGAKDKYSGSCCIVDCGTAVTIDALDAQGVHRGGVILPGVKTMRKALLENTKIDVGDNEVEFSALSKTTEGAIHTGCISSVAGGIEYVVNKMTSDYDDFDQLILTGGDAQTMQTYLATQTVIDDTLVLDGLKALSQEL